MPFLITLFKSALVSKAALFLFSKGRKFLGLGGGKALSFIKKYPMLSFMLPVFGWYYSLSSTTKLIINASAIGGVGYLVYLKSKTARKYTKKVKGLVV